MECLLSLVKMVVPLVLHMVAMTTPNTVKPWAHVPFEEKTQKLSVLIICH
jgi:hypothetical protein